MAFTLFFISEAEEVMYPATKALPLLENSCHQKPLSQSETSDKDLLSTMDRVTMTMTVYTGMKQLRQLDMKMKVIGPGPLIGDIVIILVRT